MLNGNKLAAYLNNYRTVTAVQMPFRANRKTCHLCVKRANTEGGKLMPLSALSFKRVFVCSACLI